MILKLKLIESSSEFFFFHRDHITCLGNHGDAPQLLGDQALHDPLVGLLHLDDVILVEHQALLPGC